MRTYFNYLVKHKWLQTVVLTLIPTFIFLLLLFLNAPYGTSQYGNNAPFDFATSVVFISIVLIVIVIFRFSSLRNPKEVDLYYALPISRKKLYLVHLLFGFAQLIIVWTVMFILGFIALVILSSGYYNEGFILLLYFIVIIYLTIIYIITSFIFLRANTIFDGIAFILLFHVLFLFISLFFSNGILGLLTMFGSNPFYSLTRWTAYLLSISVPRPSNYTTDYFIRSLPPLILNTLFFLGLSIYCYLYNLKTIEHEKTENIGQISASKFGYRLYIPLIIVFAIGSVFFIGSIITWLLIAVFISAGFIGFFIFRRTAKIELIDIGFILVPAIIGVILGIIIN
jgi:ABC-type transport system involved in multi-copper enzyme maturation permease subunit